MKNRDGVRKPSFHAVNLMTPAGHFRWRIQRSVDKTDAGILGSFPKCARSLELLGRLR